MKKWWVRAILVSVAWAALLIGAGIIHTDVVLKGKIAEAQDEAISGRYGMACGVGMVAIWILFFLLGRRKSEPKE